MFPIVALIVFIWLVVPKLWFWWCMHSMCMASGSVCGVGVPWGDVGSSYVNVSAAKWAMTCVSGNGLMYGVLLWYQLLSGITSIVTVVGSYLADRRAQCIACWANSSLCGCANPMPFHLYWRAVPSDPNILSLVWGE